jgi:hypothetical protein
MKVNGWTILAVVLVAVGIIWWVYASGAGAGSPAGASPLASATLTPTGGSGVSGTVSFVPTSDGQSTSVTTSLSGLQRDTVYGVTVHNGACLGPRLFVLSSVVGNANGQGSSTTTVPAQPGTYWYVVVHASASPDAPVVACGQAQVSGTTPGYVAPNGSNQPGYRAPVQNQQPFQLPNGGGGPPRTPIPTPGR